VKGNNKIEMKNSNDMENLNNEEIKEINGGGNIAQELGAAAHEAFCAAEDYCESFASRWSQINWFGVS
jgi:hypothetical protein